LERRKPPTSPNYEARQADGGGRHPFIPRLLTRCQSQITNWTVEGRAKWLPGSGHIFDLMYKGTGEIKISAKAEEHTT